MIFLDDEPHVPFRCRECGYYSFDRSGCMMHEGDKLLSCPAYSNVPGNDYYDPDFRDVPFPEVDV